MARWLTTREFCTKYGYTSVTLFNWRKQGKIRWLKKGNFVYWEDPGLLENLTAVIAPREVKEKDMIPIIRVKEMAEILGITTRRVFQLVNSGRLGYRKIGKTRRFTVNNLREYIAYRELRKQLKNGSRTIPHPSVADRRRVVIAWVKQRLAESP